MLTTSKGHPYPLGASACRDGVNFSLFSRSAVSVSLLLFKAKLNKPWREIELSPTVNRTGDIWHIELSGVNGDHQYAYRISKTNGHHQEDGLVIIDPYSKAISGNESWGKGGKTPHWQSLIVEDDFEWGGDRPLNRPLRETIIYELHVRGFTKHRSSGVKAPGTYQGLIEKIPYLQELGVTAVELLPVAEFNENEVKNLNPTTGKGLKNYWGYSSLAFFAPKASYAAEGGAGHQVYEFKKMVKALHQANIEVILDIVLNHTGEGESTGPTVCFRGLEPSVYYLLDDKNTYLNLSGCGNTVNCNHPVVRGFIIDCLRYWVSEMHVDGFRFDLASIFSRGEGGEVLTDAPIIEEIAEDPILANTKIIAEAWDANGLYQVGSFSDHPRWSEWNGRYRDDIRAFLCGHQETTASLATRIAGSSDLYLPSGRRPFNSINFITSHDGFTLYDLVSYNHKHNEDNGEENKDGENHNLSWNSGTEGPSRKKSVNTLRTKRMKTLAVIMLLSQGTPMLLAGDEFCRTQRGNNNAYCQDSKISWLDWTLVQKNEGMFRFFKMLIDLRKSHPLFRRNDFFPNPPGRQPEILWQGRTRGKEDWSANNKILCFLLAASGRAEGNDFFIILNGHHKSNEVEIPPAPNGEPWRLLIDTNRTSPLDIVDTAQAARVDSDTLKIAGMGAIVMTAPYPANSNT